MKELCFVLALLAASPAFSQVYVRGAAVSAEASEAGEAITGAVGLGYDAGLLRFQGDVTRVDLDPHLPGIVLVATDDVTVVALTAYVDAPAVGGITAFAGLGGDALMTERRTFSGRTTTSSEAGWHWSAGASAALTDRVTVDLEYRQTRAVGDAPATPDLDTLSVGARIGF